jgi:Zn-dependent protease with chaperone function
MIFNNIIYFILVLLLFNISQPVSTPGLSLSLASGGLIVTWLIYAALCRLTFRALLHRIERVHGGDASRFTGKYFRLVSGLSILAILFFALAVYFFSLKYWVQRFPGAEGFSVIGGIIALSIYLFYLATLWHFAYPVYTSIFGTEISRVSYIRSNLNMNLPILFPWVALSLLYDLMALTPWARPGGFVDSIEGQTFIFGVFLTVLMIFMPGLVQFWWGCRPLEGSEKGRALRLFLKEKGFRYRNLLNWPIFEGKMMTAGIMGIIPRYRYILVTESLVEALSLEELKAVLAHEMAHAKYRHLLFYVFFFIGYIILSYGMFDLFFYLFAIHPVFADFLVGTGQNVNLFYMALALPMLTTLYIYFRYIIGFFMRNFERQADLYSAIEMGTPKYTISSLEKIAYLSGKSRDLPSWHHFSIRERVDCLMSLWREPRLFKRHNRYIVMGLLGYLLCLGGVTYVVNFSPIRGYVTFLFTEKVLRDGLEREPADLERYEALAMIYHEKGEYEGAIEIYEKLIRLDPARATALNNLAWLLVTATDESVRDEERGLDLAKRAVELEKSPIFLDTLAEAYHVNGRSREAVETIQKALSLARENRGYYEEQLKRFYGSGG